MPLLSKRIFNCVKPLSDVKTDEKAYTIQHTKEQFRSKEEYEKRYELYKKRIWTCQSTGHTCLTHEEAWNSEKTVLKTLKEQFAPCYDKPVLELVHHSTNSLECLVDQAWLMLQQVLVVGERVLLKVKSAGKSMKAVVVKVDKAGVEANPTSNCSSPSSDKENSEKDDNVSPQKKWVPPKLLPYKYSIRFENEDSVIHSVPATDLSRGDKPPSKELLRLFIRTYAIRAGQAPNSPWIVDDSQVKKLDLQSKFASFLLSPVKWRPDEVVKKLDEEAKNHMSPNKVSPRIKPKMDAKEEKRKEKASKSIKKLQEKTERAKAKKDSTPKKKKNEVLVLDVSDDSDEESGDVKNKSQTSVVEVSDSDSDTPLSVVKNQMTPIKKKKKVSGEKEKSKPKTKKTKTLSLADLKRQLEKKKKKKDKHTIKEKKSKKGQDPKQLTLFDISSKKKGAKTPEKKSKSPTKQKTPTKGEKTPEKKKIRGPPKTPIVVQKIQKAIKNGDKTLVGMYVAKAAKILTSSQISKLPPDIKERVQKKFDLIQEKQKMARMSEKEKKEYLAEKAAKKREELKQKMKEKKKYLSKKYEDTDLDLTPLPDPKAVPTPDGMPNEIFGDVAMVTEFISCYSGLLMPESESPVYTDDLMKALASGKDGFVYLSNVVMILLQTLLQDQLAKDYKEVRVRLADISVTPYSTSELVRLCLRKQDFADDGSDNSEDLEDEAGEVPDDLVQHLESQSLHQLTTEQKVQILKGLCLRVMNTYSVQDHMEEKQQAASRLWREKLSQYKSDKEKKAEEKLKKKEAKIAEKEAKNGELETKDKDQKKELPGESSNLLLTHFYGKKEDGPASGNNSESTMDADDDEDLASKVKRRRMTTAQAQELRRQREIEEKIQRQKNMELLKEQKMKESFEKQFVEGLHQAKIAMRQAPIGTDRNHARYWIFTDVNPGLYVEKGWVGEEMEYTCQKEDSNEEDVDSSSSEEEDDAQEVDGQSSGRKPRARKSKCLDTTVPHIGQNLWFFYDNIKDVDTLIEALHPQGSRESDLKKELLKRHEEIAETLTKIKRESKEEESCDGDEEMINGFRRELLETEMRLRNGGLGGVDDYQTWSIRLETAVGLPALGDCLLDTQQYVLEKFRTGMMASKKKKTVDVAEGIKEESEEEEEEEEDKKELKGIVEWRDAVKSAPSLSRLHVLLGILDSCIRWEKSAENAKCKVCRRKADEDELLLCDICNQPFHLYCLRPQLHSIPKGDWHCPACKPRQTKLNMKNFGMDETDIVTHKREVKSRQKEIVHDELCFGCGGTEDEAELIECAECPGVYHLDCHDPPLRHPPRGRWVCNNCKNGIKTRQSNPRSQRSSTRAAVKRKRKESTSEESEEDDSETELESEDEDSAPPARKAARTSRGRGQDHGSRSETSRGERSRYRRSAPSPDIEYDIRPKVSRRAPSELSLMEEIINNMLDFKHAWPFYLNVNKRDVPDYYDIIKQPISFQKIKDRLNCLVYGSPQEVIDDVALLFRNAVEYNKVGSEVYDCIEVSEKYFLDQIKKHLPFYAYNRDKVSNGYGDHMYTDDGRRSRKSK